MFIDKFNDQSLKLLADSYFEHVLGDMYVGSLLGNSTCERNGDTQNAEVLFRFILSGKTFSIKLTDFDVDISFASEYNNAISKLHKINMYRVFGPEYLTTFEKVKKENLNNEYLRIFEEINKAVDETKYLGDGLDEMSL